MVLISGFSYQCSRKEKLEETEVSRRAFDVQSMESAQEKEEIQVSTVENSVEGSFTEESETQKICVHIAGAVQKPGVYILEAGSRVYQGIEAAGGVCEDADIQDLNLAKQMKDAQKVYVQKVGEDLTKTNGGLEQYIQESDDFSDSFGVNEDFDEVDKLNLNTAGKEQLVTLVGIGEKRAEDIIEYRNKHGRFESVKDIMKVPGIKESAYEKIKDRITAR